MRAVAVMVLALAMGCAPTITSGGLRVRRSHWALALSEIQPRATLHLQCPAEQIDYTLRQRIGRTPVLVQADGCGRSVLYSKAMRRGRFATVWELEASAAAASAATAAAPDLRHASKD